MKQYIIRSTNRQEPYVYFAAIHGYSPMFFEREKARRFSSEEMATAYARIELFTEDAAFAVEAVKEIA